MAGPGIPLFTLVRTDTLASQVPQTYNSSTEAWVNSTVGTELDRRDEIKLVDHNGEPCAMPTSQDFKDEDLRFNFTDGTTVVVPRFSRHEINLACDFLPDAARRRLLRWKGDRASVEFTPGYGVSTEAAWRPVPMNYYYLERDDIGDSYSYDLTGRHVMTNFGDSKAYVWDTWTNPDWPIWRYSTPDENGAYTRPSHIVPTPHGAGQDFQAQIGNRWNPRYPESATEGFGTGNAGWRKGGLQSTHITLTHVTNGFGFNVGGIGDPIDTLRVTTTNAADSSRWLSTAGAFDPADGDYLGYTFSGTGNVSVALWVRGKFSKDASIYLQAGGSLGANTTVDSVAMSGVDGSGWRCVYLNHYSASWGSTYFPKVYIDLPALTYGDRSDFEIGPMMIGWGGTKGYNLRWSSAASESSTYNDRLTIGGAAFNMPKVGSATMSYFVPPEFDSMSDQPAVLWRGLFTIGDVSGVGRLYLVNAGTSGWRYSFAHVSTASWTSPYFSLTEGVHSFSLVWGNKYVAMMHDGEVVYESIADSVHDAEFLSGSQQVTISDSTYGCHPIVPLSFRIDHAEMRDELKHVHAALTDPVALGTIVAARARTYEIVSVPSIPRIVDGATYWTGSLVIRQKSYNHFYGDITSEEV